MANYKVVDADQLDADMTTVADAIRERAGTSEKMEFPDGLAKAVKNIPSGAEFPTLTNPGTASDLAEGVELIDADGNVVTGELPEWTSIGTQNTTPTYDSENEKIVLQENHTSKVIVKPGYMTMRSLASNFGDATAADVVKGKTFTSAAGLLVEGTHECEAGSGGYASGDVVKALAASATLASGYSSLRVTYGDSVGITDGAVALTGMTTTLSVSSESSLDAVKGKYVKAMSGSIYYIPEDATITQSGTTYSKGYTTDKANLMFILA